MPTIYTQIAFLCWPILAIVWLLGQFGNKKTIKRADIGRYTITSILIPLSFLFTFSFHNMGIFQMQITPQTGILPVIGMCLTIVSVLFAIWARITLGRNWSGSTATFKEGHELIQSGPYAIVRHPIYTGFLFGLLGVALTLGTSNSYFGVLLLVISFSMRIKIEEKLMTEEFPDAYPEYKKRVKTFVPLIW